MTQDEIRELAEQVQDGATGKTRQAFIALARLNGYEGTAGGWVRHPSDIAAIGQGWASLATQVCMGLVKLTPEHGYGKMDDLVHHVTPYGNVISCGVTGAVPVTETASKVTCPDCTVADYATLVERAHAEALDDDRDRRGEPDSYLLDINDARLEAVYEDEGRNLAKVRCDLLGDFSMPHGGEVRPYRTVELDDGEPTNAMICDAHAPTAPDVWHVKILPVSVDEEHAEALSYDQTCNLCRKVPTVLHHPDGGGFEIIGETCDDCAPLFRDRLNADHAAALIEDGARLAARFSVGDVVVIDDGVPDLATMWRIDEIVTDSPVHPAPYAEMVDDVRGGETWAALTLLSHAPRCTSVNGPGPHAFEHNPGEAEVSAAGNDGYGEWERCGQLPNAAEHDAEAVAAEQTEIDGLERFGAEVRTTYACRPGYEIRPEDMARGLVEGDAPIDGNPEYHVPDHVLATDVALTEADRVLRAGDLRRLVERYTERRAEAYEQFRLRRIAIRALRAEQQLTLATKLPAKVKAMRVAQLAGQIGTMIRSLGEIRRQAETYTRLREQALSELANLRAKADTTTV